MDYGTGETKEQAEAGQWLCEQYETLLADYRKVRAALSERQAAHMNGLQANMNGNTAMQCKAADREREAIKSADSILNDCPER